VKGVTILFPLESKWTRSALRHTVSEYVRAAEGEKLNLISFFCPGPKSNPPPPLTIEKAGLEKTVLFAELQFPPLGRAKTLPWISSTSDFESGMLAIVKVRKVVWPMVTFPKSNVELLKKKVLAANVNPGRSRNTPITITPFVQVIHGYFFALMFIGPLSQVTYSLWIVRIENKKQPTTSNGLLFYFSKVMFQLPSVGRHTARSAFPSPS
jgi:hypothetical protein